MNRLEKEEFLPSSYVWTDIRDLRNHLAHEYPTNPEIRTDYLNSCPDAAKNLLGYWGFMRPKVLKLIGQEPH